MVVLTKKGITVTITGSPTVTTLHDGNFLVHLGSGGSAVVTAWTPAQSGSGVTLRNGASFNLPSNARMAGQPTVPATPFDGRINLETEHTLTLPKTCVPGDQIIIGKSTTTMTANGVPRSAYWSENGDSFVDEMMSVTFVAYEQGSDHLAVMRLGEGFVPRLLRSSFPILQEQIDQSLLPSVVDLTGLSGVTVPSWSYFEDLFSDFCGEVVDGWNTRVLVPNFQNPGYGRNFASVVSQAMVMLCSTEDVGDKMPLAVSMVQWGLDLAGAWAGGRRTFPLGGQAFGHKGLIILAGHLLGIEAIADPDSSLGTGKFNETNGVASFNNPANGWWFDPSGWPIRVDTFATGDGEFLKNHPSSWTLESQVNNNHSSDEFKLIGYLAHKYGASVGTALAMELMGRRAAMGEQFMDFMELWMEGPGPTAIAQLAATTSALGNIPWGQDFVIGQGAGLCRAAWGNHFP